MEAIFNTAPSDIVSQIEARLVTRNTGDTQLVSLTTFCDALATLRGPDNALPKLPPRSGSNSDGEDIHISVVGRPMAMKDDLLAHATTTK
ncbi:hypothetical protein BG011_000417, partial [Mortierella polycephala]